MEPKDIINPVQAIATDVVEIADKTGFTAGIRRLLGPATDEVAEMWSISRDSVTRLFRDEAGVMKISRPGSRYKRTYTTIRNRKAC